MNKLYPLTFATLFLSISLNAVALTTPLEGLSDFSAGAKTIDFEGHVPNTAANELYSSQEVHFNRGDGKLIPIDNVPTEHASSGENFLATTIFSGANTWSTSLNVVFDFDVFEIGAFTTNYTCLLELYDATDTLIGSQTIASDWETLVFNGLTSDTGIRRARFETNDIAFAVSIDDLTFNRNRSTSVPDSGTTLALLGLALAGLAAVRRRFA